MKNEPLVFNAVNEIEKLQEEAVHIKEKRTVFWQALFNEEVYVLSEYDNNEVVFHTWESNGEDVCGVFTSKEKLIEAMPVNTPYIKVNARVIFEAIAEENLSVFINPRYTIGVKLNSKELMNLLK